MPNYQRRIVYLSEAQREELFSNGSITVNGTTITYNANDMYVTPQEEPYVKPASGIPASDLASGVVPDLTNYVQKTDYATVDSAGLVKVQATFGFVADSSGNLKIFEPTDTAIKNSSSPNRVVTPSKQHAAVFYGLAKAAGDTTQALSDNAVGTYTADASAAIRTMLGAVGSTDYATSTTAGVVKTGEVVYLDNENKLRLSGATATQIKNGANANYPITPSLEHSATFYGLAKAAGDTTQAQSDNVVGTYTADASAAIRTMLGAVGTADYATSSTGGTVKVNSNYGLTIDSGTIKVSAAGSASVKSGQNANVPIAPSNQHESVFYGLAKIAGSDERNSSLTAGTYTDAAKTAIQTMLGIDAIASTKADKNNTVITGSLSMGRLANSTVGENSTAIGYNSTASSVYAFASGYNNVSSGAFSTTVGYNNAAYGKASFSGGMGTATGPSGEAAFAYGRGISSLGSYMTGFGLYSIVPTLFPEWVAGTSYSVGDRVTNSIYGYECITANSDSTFNGSKWKTLWYNSDTAFVIGNGSGTSSDRSNAFKIDINGNVYLGKDIYVNCNADSTGGTKLESGVSFVETVSGTTPSITGEPNTRYMCGEVTSITIAAPSAGTIDVVFTSGSTPAVLTVTPPTGMTMKWPAWFDPTSLATNTTYEINIMDGVYGAVMAW